MSDLQYWDGTTAHPAAVAINKTLASSGGTGGTPGAPLVAIYYSTPTSSTDPVFRTETDFGTTPRMISGYILQSETSYDLSTTSGQNKRDIYRGVMDRGCGVYITITYKDGTGTWNHNDMANQVSGAIANMDKWLEFSSDLRQYAAARGLPFYTGWESEFEVKVNHGTITGVSFQTFASSHDLFCQRAKLIDPDLQTIYQVGHFQGDPILEVLSYKQVPMDVMGLDPYRGDGSGDITIKQTIEGKVTNPAQLRANADFQRLGPPRIAITETGTHVPGFTDSNLETWINSIPTAMTDLDLEFVIWFNSGSGPNNDSNLITARDGTPQNKPLAVAALASLIDKNNHA